MSKRIANIISRIYRHPTAGRQAIALSRADAEHVPLLPGVAMISITAPERLPANLPPYEHLLRTSFSDVEFLSKDLTARARKKLSEAMSTSQASELISYVGGLPDSIHTLLVHCEGGYSRSCGVVAALGKLFEYQVEAERLMKANQSVQTTLIMVANNHRR